MWRWACSTNRLNSTRRPLCIEGGPHVAAASAAGPAGADLASGERSRAPAGSGGLESLQGHLLVFVYSDGALFALGVSWRRVRSPKDIAI